MRSLPSFAYIADKATRRSAMKAFVWSLVICGPAIAHTEKTSIGGSDEVNFDRRGGSMGIHEVLRTPSFSVSTNRTRGSYSLLIRNASGLTVAREMLDTPWDINAAHLAVDGKVVVDLASNGGIDDIYIASSMTPTMLDHFGCRMPSLSPDGRFLVFLAWYPSHGGSDDLTSDFAMVYDLREDTMENRHKPRIDFPAENNTDRQVGAQLYPQSRPLDPHAVSNDTPRPIHYIHDFTWSSDSTKLVFLDEQQGGQRLAGGAPVDGNLRLSARVTAETLQFLVLVDFRNAAPQLRRFQVPTCKEISGTQCQIEVTGATFTPDGISFAQHIGGPKSAGQQLYLSYRQFAKWP